MRIAASVVGVDRVGQAMTRKISSESRSYAAATVGQANAMVVALE